MKTSEIKIKNGILRAIKNGDSLYGPESIEIAPTYGCNHSCIHCSYQQVGPYGGQKRFLPLAPFQRFVDDFCSLGGKEVYFAGNGEPLLHPEFAKILDICKSNGLRTGMSTNGVLLTPEKTAEIIEKLDWLKFSVNGGNAEDYSMVHNCPPSDFETLVGNLQEVKRLKNNGSVTNLHLIMQTLLTEGSPISIEDVIKLHKSLGTDLLMLREAIFIGRSPKADFSRFHEIARIHKEDKSIFFEFFERPQERQEWTKCWGIYGRTNLDEKGNLFACCRNFYQNCIYGNICEKSFREIWNSETRKALFRKLLDCGSESECGLFCSASKDNLAARDFAANISFS